MIIGRLQSLRGIFALIIFFHHFYYPNGAPLCPPGGDCGVAFFLILSGFVMTDGYSAKVMADSFSYNRFMGLRLARLWPLHLLCLGVALAIYRWGYPPAIVLNAMMLQSWVPEKLFYFSGNAVSWCLADIMFCYAVFPLLIRAIRRSPATALIIFTLICAGVLAFGLWVCPQPLVVPLMYIWPPTRLLDYTLGIFLWMAFRHHGTGLRCTAAGQWLALALLAVTFALYGRVDLALGSAMLWWLPQGLLIFFCASPAPTFLGRLLDWSPLVAFGNVSFSFYMLHVLAGDFLGQFLAHFGLAIPWGVFLILDLAICVALAFVCHSYFEKPINQRLRSIIKTSTFK